MATPLDRDRAPIDWDLWTSKDRWELGAACKLARRIDPDLKMESRAAIRLYIRLKSAWGMPHHPLIPPFAEPEEWRERRTRRVYVDPQRFVEGLIWLGEPVPDELRRLVEPVPTAVLTLTPQRESGGVLVEILVDDKLRGAETMQPVPWAVFKLALDSPGEWQELRDGATKDLPSARKRIKAALGQFSKYFRSSPTNGTVRWNPPAWLRVERKPEKPS
jgi:hypothetical protein